MKSFRSLILSLFPRLQSREFYAETFDFRSGLGDSAWVLYGLARSLKPKVCVEIGSARGKSACAVGLALRRNGGGRLYAIDPHRPTSWNDTDSVDSLGILQRHLRESGAAEHVEILRQTSAEAAQAWNRPIDLLFIDGDHSYEGVKADWELFLPHLTPWATVVFHDTLWDLRPDPAIARADMGVPRFVDELRLAGYPVLTISQDFGVSLVQPCRGGVPLRPEFSGREAVSAASGVGEKPGSARFTRLAAAGDRRC
jgi:predicted O-methyltransferase YrrM